MGRSSSLGRRLQGVRRLWANADLRRGRGAEPGPRPRPRGLRGKLLIPATRSRWPLASPPPARTGTQVGWRPGAGAGHQRGEAGDRTPADTTAIPPRNRRSLQRTILGLVVLGSPRGRLASSRKVVRRGDEKLHFPGTPQRLGSPGKRPGRRRFPGAMGPVWGRWLRGPRAVPPEAVPRGEDRGPGAEPMSRSVAGPDCCGGLGNIDFRQVLSGKASGEPADGPRRPAEPAARGCRLQRLVGGPTVTRQRGRGEASGWAGACAWGRRGSWGGACLLASLRAAWRGL